MGWAESNASRRGLLGQLAGQFTEMAKMKQAKRQNTQDILAGYGQQALGVLGQQQLETQRQAGESALAGEKHGYQLAEDINRISKQSGADMAYLEKQLKELYPNQDKWKQEAELERMKAEYAWAKSQDPSLTVKEFILGYAPVEGGKDEMDEMQKALSDPVGWASTMLYMYMQKEGIDAFITGGLPEENRDDFLQYGTRFVDIQFPNMSEFDKNRLKAAIQNTIRVPPVSDEGGVSAEGGAPPFGHGFRAMVGTLGAGAGEETALEREARDKQMTALIPQLRKKQATLDKKDPSYKEITNLLALTLRGKGLLFSTEWDLWLKRAQAIVEPGERLYNLR